MGDALDFDVADSDKARGMIAPMTEDANSEMKGNGGQSPVGDNPRPPGARPHDDAGNKPATSEERADRDETRREIVAAGIKLAFVTPLVSSFLARDAQAAGSNHSCYPAGAACGGGKAEPCCPGLFCIADIDSGEDICG